MTNLDPFFIALTSALLSVAVARAFARHELKAIEAKHKNSQMFLESMHQSAMRQQKVKHDHQVLTILKAAYAAGYKDAEALKGKCKCAAKSK
jgi:hypothetical protein